MRTIFLFTIRFFVFVCFIMFFISACENTEQAPDGTNTTQKTNDGNTRGNKRRSSSSGSSTNGSSTSGSPTGETSTCGTGACPQASSLGNCRSLTTITFHKYFSEPEEPNDPPRECVEGSYTHPYFNFPDDEDGCNCGDRSKGSASPNRGVILSVWNDSNLGTSISLNEDVVGPIQDNTYYIYYKHGESEINRFEFRVRNRNSRWQACECSGRSRPNIAEMEFSRLIFSNRKICEENNKIKFWLAKQTSTGSNKSCEFFH